MGWWQWTVVAGLLLMPFAAQAGPPPSSATFTYGGPSALEGDLSGTCATAGLLFDPVPAVLDIEVAAGRLVERTTTINQTAVYLPSDDILTEDVQGMDEQSFPLSAGRVRISSTPSALAVGFMPGHLGPAGEPTEAEWVGVRAERTAFEESRPAPGTSAYVALPSGPALKLLVFSGPTQVVTLKGDSVVRGDLEVYLREAAVEADGLSRPSRPHRQTTFEAAAPGTHAAARRTIEVADSVLHLQGVRLDLPRGARLVCAGGHTNVDGQLVVEDATGNLEGGAERVTFERRALNLAGRFRLEETGAGNGGQAVASGELRAAALDFAPVAPSAGSPAVAILGWTALAALLLTGLVKYAGSLVGIFYSRFGRDEALENPSRDLVYRAIDANPGIDLTELGALTSMHRATVTYHIRVLERVGLVAMVRRGRSVRVLRRELHNAQDLPRVLSAREEGLAFLREALSAGDQPLRDVVNLVAERLQLTRRAAYQFIDRAVRLGAARRFELDGEVRIACPAG